MQAPGGTNGRGRVHVIQLQHREPCASHWLAERGPNEVHEKSGVSSSLDSWSFCLRAGVRTAGLSRPSHPAISLLGLVVWWEKPLCCLQCLCHSWSPHRWSLIPRLSSVPGGILQGDALGERRSYLKSQLSASHHQKQCWKMLQHPSDLTYLITSH